MPEKCRYLPPDYYEAAIRNNPLQKFWHNRRFKNVIQLTSAVKGEVLDIGCADGTFTILIAKQSRAKRTIGIDILADSIKYASSRFRKNKNLEFRVADGTCLPFPDSHFEAVFCLEMLEHVLYPGKVLEEAKRVLKPGGYLVALVPTDSAFFRIIWWFVIHTWGKHWQGTHIQSFSKENSLAKVVEGHGFIIEKERKFLLGMLQIVRAEKK
jgi:ubiquinone/menaquinone biosynthesis C-methylase UbiE